MIKSIIFSTIFFSLLYCSLYAMQPSAPSREISPEIEANLRSLAVAKEHGNYDSMQAIYPLLYDYNNDSMAKLVMLFVYAVELKLWHITDVLAQTVKAKSETIVISDEYLMTALQGPVSKLMQHDSQETRLALQHLLPVLKNTWLHDYIQRSANPPRDPHAIVVTEVIEDTPSASWFSWPLTHWKLLLVSTGVVAGCAYYWHMKIK